MHQKQNQASYERGELKAIIYELWLEDKSREEELLMKIAGLSDIQTSYVLSQIQIEELSDNPEKIHAIIIYTRECAYNFISDVSSSIH